MAYPAEMRSKIVFVDVRRRAFFRIFWACGALGFLAQFAFVQPVLARQLSQTNSVHCAPLSRPGGRALSIGFYVNDENSFPDLKKVSPHLDWLIPSWLTLEGQNLTLRAHVDQTVLRYLNSAKPDMPILPMVQNYSGDKWDGGGLAKLLADARARAALIQNLKTFLDQNGFQGLTVDFEEVPPSAHPDLKLFLRGLRNAFADRSYAIILAVPIDDDGWPYETYVNIADYLLLMGYDEHWSTGSPGSIAGQSWFEKALNKRMRELDPAKTIVALGAYGYDWAEGGPAAPLSFQEAMLSAQGSKSDILFGLPTLNPHFSFVEDGGKRHDIWFLDGVTVFNEIHTADAYQPAGYALWRIGSEDPSVWSVMARPYGASVPGSLHYIGQSQDMSPEGGTEAQPRRGERTFETDNDGNIVGEVYLEGPESLQVNTGAER